MALRRRNEPDTMMLSGDPLDRAQQALEVARDQILRCRGITHHFMRLSRGQRSPGDLVDLAPAVDAVARLIEPTARAHMVHIEVRPIPSDARVRTDEAELQHTLINLLLNAADATPATDPIDLSVAADGNEACILVRDRGPGVPPALRARVFEPFFSTKHGGTGLGLPTVQRIVEQHGGTITIDDAPGGGALFTVRLPARAPLD